MKQRKNEQISATTNIFFLFFLSATTNIFLKRRKRRHIPNFVQILCRPFGSLADEAHIQQPSTKVSHGGPVRQCLDPKRMDSKRASPRPSHVPCPRRRLSKRCLVCFSVAAFLPPIMPQPGSCHVPSAAATCRSHGLTGTSGTFLHGCISSSSR
jgi:hypothetical protein